jgi:arylsulfatase A-like enzyme
MRNGASPRSALILAFAFCWLGCGDTEKDAHPNIVLISIDTLRADHMPVYGYERDTTPEISRYLAGAQVFQHAYTAACYTSGSVATMLSGLNPVRHGVRDFFRKLPEDVPILPDHLRELGYQTAAVVSNTVLTDEALGIASRFDFFDDFVDERELHRDIYERRASRTTDAALRWLAMERAEDRSHFLWIHYMDPHAPYQPPADEISVRYSHEGSRALEGDLSDSYQRLPGVTDGLDYIDRYDEEIAYTDREIGRFLAAYQKRGLLDDAIVILTSDHGEVLLEHAPHFQHSNEIWQEVLRVPLMIRWPGATPPRNTIAVSLADLTPTLLDHLGASVEGLDGIPLGDRIRSDLLLQESWGRGRTENPGVPRRSAIQGLDKWIFEVDALGTISVLAHHRLRDDTEVETVMPENRTRKSPTERLAKHIARESEQANRGSTAGTTLRGPKPAPPLEPHQVEALRALGYVE